MIYSEDNKERDLLELARDGDSSALKELYKQYIGYLTAVCARYISIDDDVRDVIQNSFIKIFTSLNIFEYRGAGSLKAWMTKIVVNESLKFLNENSKFKLVKDETELPKIAYEDDSDDEPNIQVVPAKIIQDMIRELPIGYRTVFNLYVFEHKSHKEIANTLNITEGTSASQLHKAKKMLAKKINKYKMT